MLNETLYWGTVDSGSRAVSRALNVCQSLSTTLYREVQGTVETPVNRAGSWDLGWAVYRCCNEPPHEEIHPGLTAYLEGVA